MKRRLLRKKRVLIPVVASLALSGSAFAAWAVYSGVDGSGSGTFETATTQKAITVTTSSSPPPLVQGATTNVGATARNNDPSVSHAIQTLTATFTTTPSTCAQYLSLKSGSTLIGATIAGGATITGNVPIEVAGAAPVTCAGATWSVTFGGTTS